MRAGSLDRRIQIQEKQTTPTTTGRLETTWIVVATVWAKLLPKNGREDVKDDERAAAADVQFEIRWRENLDPTMRIIYQDRVYGITDISEKGRRERLILSCVVRERDSKKDL